LMPTPITSASTRPAWSWLFTQDACELAPVAQHVVGPLHAQRLRRCTARARAHDRARPRASARPSGGATPRHALPPSGAAAPRTAGSGRSPQASGARAGRALGSDAPARNTLPLAAPCRAAASASSLVEPVRSPYVRGSPHVGAACERRSSANRSTSNCPLIAAARANAATGRSGSGTRMFSERPPLAPSA
jgi:hypothetical protein